MGHEYVGVVEEVGAEVETVKPGQFVVGSFSGLPTTPARSAGPATRAPA
jgi:threonine dehydrogenase-like Zn-dependent dehydrogenase